MLTHGSLFSGIGGFDLGFQWAGIETIWQVEKDFYCRKVLEKNFPNARRYEDIHDVVRWHHLDWVDVISGGFPCQDISHAGKRVGIDGERSGLWSEMWRVIRAMAPRFVVVENVSALLNRGMERVLGDLASGGYDAEWDVLPASAFGAPHIRQRVFIVAYLQANSSCSNPDIKRLHRAAIDQYREAQLRDEQISESGSLGEDVADSNRAGCEQQRRSVSIPAQCTATQCSGKDVADSTDRRLSMRGWSPGSGRHALWSDMQAKEWPSQAWAVEPNVGRVAYGVPSRVDRLKGLGNAVVPQIAQWIAERIKQVA